MAKQKWADQEAEMLCKGGDAFQAWKAAYKLAKGFKAHHKIHNPMRMKQADGSYAQNDFQNTEVFKENFNQLLNNIKKHRSISNPRTTGPPYFLEAEQPTNLETIQGSTSQNEE